MREFSTESAMHKIDSVFGRTDFCITLGTMLRSNQNEIILPENTSEKIPVAIMSTSFTASFGTSRCLN